MTQKRRGRTPGTTKAVLEARAKNKALEEEQAIVKQAAMLDDSGILGTASDSESKLVMSDVTEGMGINFDISDEEAEDALIDEMIAEGKAAEDAAGISPSDFKFDEDGNVILTPEQLAELTKSVQPQTNGVTDLDAIGQAIAGAITQGMEANAPKDVQKTPEYFNNERWPFPELSEAEQDFITNFYKQDTVYEHYLTGIRVHQKLRVDGFCKRNRVGMWIIEIDHNAWEGKVRALQAPKLISQLEGHYDDMVRRKRMLGEKQNVLGIG